MKYKNKFKTYKGRDINQNIYSELKHNIKDLSQFLSTVVMQMLVKGTPDLVFFVCVFT